MSKEEKENVLVENIGGYVIKTGKYYVKSYRRSFMLNINKYPNELTDNLRDVKDILYNIDAAKEVAEQLNGKIYQICAEPVGKSKNAKV